MRRLGIVLIGLMLMAGCRQTPVIEMEDEQASYEENMIQANKYMAQTEETQIDAYIARRGWNMEKMPEGGRMWIYSKGTGKAIGFEDTVSIVYSLEAINGAKVYEQMEETVVVGRHQPNVGIDNALLKMRRGDKARIVLPSNLGYGVAGDGDRITGRMTLVYDLCVE